MTEGSLGEKKSYPPSTEISLGEDAYKRPTARYVSATTVCEERLDSGRLVGVYWSASGYVQRENTTESLPELDPLEFPLNAFELEIDGQSLHNRWRWVSATKRSSEKPGMVEAVIKLQHRLRPVAIDVVTRLDGTPFLTRWLEIANAGDERMALSHVSPWSGMFWSWKDTGFLRSDASPFTLGYFDSLEWGTEGNFTWKPLPKGTYRIDTRGGRGGSGHGGPYFIVRNELTGECAMGALAWPGNWFMEFWYNPLDRFIDRSVRGAHLVREFILSFRMAPMGRAPLRVIEPGETVRSPEMHLAMLHKNLDLCVQHFHDHLRRSVIPPRPRGRELFTIAGRVVERPGDWVLREVDIAAALGVEAFVVDAGWYGEEFTDWWKARGDWFEGDWLPGGLTGVRDYVHNKGMLFGLWIEPETICRASRLFKEHPQWIQKTDEAAEDRLLTGESMALDFTRPEVVKYAEDSILRVIRDYNLDFFKLDYNISVGEGGQRARDGYAEHEQWRHFEALSSIFDRVRKEFPNLVLENCAGGGGRNDLGMLSLFHCTVESDWSVHPFAIRAINGLTMFIPPESIVYYHHHIGHAHQTADLDTHLRVTLFANTVFAGFGAQDADAGNHYFQKVRHYVQLARNVIRPILASHPCVYHHTPNIGVISPAEWCILEYASGDGSASYAGIFRLSGESSQKPSHELIFRPRGLDPEKQYRVTLDNSGKFMNMDGAELMIRGVPVYLDMPLTSELLVFRARTAHK